MNWRVLILLAISLALPARAAVRFDVFPGYDGIVPEGSWFPFVFEISNDGPTFNGVVKVAASQYDQAGSRLVPVELPTGTLKRLSVPVFASGRYVITWDAQLLDEKGKVVAESLGIRPRKVNPWTIPLAGAISRTPPVIANIKPRQEDLQPIIARLQPSVFPDNPIALEGLRTIYLSSEKALDLSANQANALMSWMHNGGHLVVGIEQIVQVNGAEWLRRALPGQLFDIAMAPNHAGVQEWLVSDVRSDGTMTGNEGIRRGNRTTEAANPYAALTIDDLFEKAPMPVAKVKNRDGKVLMGSANEPLALIAARGRGQITALLFSPELEPFVSWKNRPYFWAKITAVPPELLVTEQYNRFGAQSIDGVFGAMIDSKQIRKLPIAWLLLLLLAYLVVIGPVDYYWLKKINRQMLTWITFPIYVALFSVLIYFIGYKLRAGETEWNELHVVDVLPVGGEAEYRGRTYASIYSPVNATYRLASQLPFATLRGEYLANYANASEGSQARVQQLANTYQADVTVPVWTSQLFVSDWLNRDVVPLTVALSREDRKWVAEVENTLNKKLTRAVVVVDEQVYEIGELPADKTTRVVLTNATPISSFVGTYGNSFLSAASGRQQVFSQNQSYIYDVPRSVMTASLVSYLSSKRPDLPGTGQFVTPPGLDLSPLVARGNAIFMAWVDNYAPIKPIHKFNPLRSHKDTLLRLTVPVPAEARRTGL
ncbi:MAG TPA: hypothetical protein VJ063_02760 [Verrucomicrobiae bacterium]|nr:hypothetical protein [Verrucomicrobiae bacterium]